MSTGVDVPGLLLNERPCRILVEIGRMDNPYASKLSNEIGVSHPYSLKIVKKLQASDLVVSEVDGRKNVLSLTEDGEAVAEALENLYVLFEPAGENP